MRTPRPGVRPILALLSAALVAGILAGPAFAAAPPKAVTIVSDVTFVDGGPNVGDFHATGAAVDTGTLCASGTFVDQGIRFAGFPARTGEVQLQVLKRFTCDDRSGTFDLKMQIKANFGTGLETFQWVITGGTDAYGSLHGSGTGTTVPREGGNTNTFVGAVL
jgi:hypothetical protein